VIVPFAHHSRAVALTLLLLGASFATGCVGAVVGSVNESAKGIGTRFKLSPADAETIEEQARLVPRVLARPPDATGLADDPAVR
jgi:hypothetical protein